MSTDLKVVTFKADAETRIVLLKLAKRLGVTQSDVIRQGIQKLEKLLER